MKIIGDAGGVFVHDDQGVPLYRGTAAEFQAEQGAAIPALPAGMTRFSYEPATKIMVYFDAKGNAFPIEGQHDDPVLLAAAATAPAIGTLKVTVLDNGAALSQRSITTKELMK